MRGTTCAISTLLALLTASAACSGSHPGADAGPVVIQNRYTLELVPLLLSAWDVGPRLELTPDGAFVGHGNNLPPPAGDPRRCAGTLTAEESATLTDALNDADALRMTDRFVCPFGADYPQWHISIAAEAGASNAFCYARCADAAPFDRVLDAAAVALARAQAAGACDGPVYDYVTGADPYGCRTTPSP